MICPLSIHFLHFQRSAFKLGLGSALKLFYCGVFEASVSIKLRDWSKPIPIRGGTADYHSFYTIFVRGDYPVTPDMNPGIVLDLGANVGYSALRFRMAFPHATIICVEPDRENFRQLTELFAGVPGIELLNNAIASKSGQTVVMEGRQGNAMVSKVVEGSAVPTSTTVLTTTIPDILSQTRGAGSVWLKIDIEGAEKDLFSIPDWLQLVEGMYLEIHAGCWKSVFDAIGPKAYECRIAGENLVIQFSK